MRNIKVTRHIKSYFLIAVEDSYITEITTHTFQKHIFSTAQNICKYPVSHKIKGLKVKYWMF